MKRRRKSTEPKREDSLVPLSPASGSPRVPPRWADRLLEWFCAPHLLEEVQGDLHEWYYKRLGTAGEKQAKRQYIGKVLGFVRPFALKRQSEQHRPSLPLSDMLRSYWTIAWRNLIRHKAFSGITIVGLALSIVCSLLIGLWVRDEISVDRYHANGPQLYRLMNRQSYDGKTDAHPFVPGLISNELPKHFPEIVRAAGFSWDEKFTLAVGDHKGKEAGGFAGSDWFRMFSIPLLQGTPGTALSSPESLALSRKLAENYFGSAEAAMGKTVRIDNQQDYRVTAVFENLPPNTSLPYDFLLSWEDYLRRNEWTKEWGNNGTRAFLQLRPDANVAAFEAKLKGWLMQTRKDVYPKGYTVELFLQPYADAYLYSETENGQIAGGRIEYVRLFSVVAAFLLLIACINFTNLATARSAKRAKEVGVRKVIGAGQWKLIGQFMGEALLLTALAVLTSLMLLTLLLPKFNELTGKHIQLPFAEPAFGLSLLGLTLLVSLLAGIYPAVFLSSLNPVRIMKGGLRFGSGIGWLRRGLVVFQFTLSILLIVGTLVVYRQVHFIQTKHLGYDRQNLIAVPLEGELGKNYSTLKQELLRLPGVQAVSRMGHLPSNVRGFTGGVQWPGKDPNTNIQFAFSWMGYDAVKLLKLTLADGREFSPAFITDSTNYLVNEAAVKRIGYQHPVGQPLTMWGQPGKIIGVIKDFHFQSLHEPIQPLIIRLGEKGDFGNLLVRAQPGQTQPVLAQLQTLCQQLNPKFTFSYSFVDDEYRKLYQSEQLISTLTKYFAGIAIFISCLGLLGLSVYTAEQRTKEIGIRKVLGASVASLVALLSGEFLKLVWAALLIASPLAWYVMHQWLQDYEYKIGIDWWVFALAGVLAALIALLTISFQSIKAALANPVKSLRSE